MKTALYLIPLLAGAVFLLIRAELFEKWRQVYIVKPLCTLLVIAVAWLSFLEPGRNALYTVGVLLGLLFSLGGDVALMFRESGKAFTVGLGLFLVAHVIYASVFGYLGQFAAWDILSTVILLAAALVFYRLIQPNLGTMKGPVISYVLVISVMVNRAFSTFASPVLDSGQAWMIAVGALLFYVSDAMLAANRFLRPWRYHHLSLAFYYSGQLLIALAGYSS